MTNKRKNEIDGLLHVVSCASGKAQFCGPNLDWTEKPREVFRVQLRDQGVKYGEWRANFVPDESEFKVNIASFGYSLPAYIGRPVEARCSYTEKEASDVADLVISLFHDALATNDIFLLSRSKANFTKEVTFLPGWIIISP